MRKMILGSNVWRVCFGLALAVPWGVQASDGFSLRHNMAGGLGSELFQTGHAPGWRGGLAYGYTAIDKVTGSDGEMLRTQVAGGSVKIGSSPNPLQDPTYAAQSVGVTVQGAQKSYSLSLTHAAPADAKGYRMEWSVIIPYGTKQQTVGAINTIPALNWPSTSSLTSSQQAGVAAGFAPAYQGGLDQVAAAETGRTSGLGDIEVTLQWVKDTSDSRLIVGAGLITPTGRYDTRAPTNMSSGNFYTLKPSVIYVQRWGDYSAGFRAALGLNTTNHDKQVRSGNFAGLELALGALTRLGSVGLHLMQAQQVQDDSGGSWGSNRYACTNWGWSFATKLPVVNLGMSLQQGRTLRSRNAQEGSFTQLRFSKSF